MADYHHRVCAVGTETQLRLLLGDMLRNAALEDTDEDTTYRPPLQQQVDALHHLAEGEGGPADGFLYEMVCRSPFGSADPQTAVMTVREFVPGLWAVLFDYHSGEALQPEDWLALQRHADRMLICAQYACTDILREKGRMLLADGKAMDNWDSVDACWFWLTRRYLCGQSPEDLEAELEKLVPELAAEDEELTPDVLISESEENLRLVAETVADREQLAHDLQTANERRDFSAATQIMIDAAEAELWDADRLPLYLSCLEEARTAWDGRG